MTTGLKISDVGILQFTNNTDNQGLGYLFVDSLFATALIERTVATGDPIVPIVSQVCQVITTQATPTSSSPSAILELDSTSGALLVSRLTQAEINQLNLNAPQNGMVLYNTTSRQFQFYQNGTWIALPSAGTIGTVTGPSTSVINNIPIWNNTTGTAIADSGVSINNGVLTVNSANNGQAILAAASNAGYLQLSSNADHSIRLLADSKAVTSSTYTLPSTLPVDNFRMLASNTAGQMSWINPLDQLGVIISNYVSITDFDTPHDPLVPATFDAGTAYFNINIPLCIDIPTQSSFLCNQLGYHSFLSYKAPGHTDDSLGDFPYYAFVTSGRILASEVDATSSINVKNILDRSDAVTNEVCELFDKISLVKYDYKDKIKEGFGVYYGVIAEELQKVLPYIVHNHREYVPNIMYKGSVSYQNLKHITIPLNGEKELDILANKEIKLLANHEIIYGLVVSNTNKEIIIELDKEYPDLDAVFIYGTKEDCPAVAKERLFEMNMVVTQNLTKQLAALVERIAILEQKLGL
mgnify:CR=1 FL=1